MPSPSVEVDCASAVPSALVPMWLPVIDRLDTDWPVAVDTPSTPLPAASIWLPETVTDGALISTPNWSRPRTPAGVTPRRSPLTVSLPAPLMTKAPLGVEITESPLTVTLGAWIGKTPLDPVPTPDPLIVTHPP